MVLCSWFLFGYLSELGLWNALFSKQYCVDLAASMVTVWPVFLTCDLAAVRTAASLGVSLVHMHAPHPQFSSQVAE